MSGNAIECTVRSLQWIYTIVIALAIGEAFKQFVPEPDRQRVTGADPGTKECRIQWDRLPSLFSFLALVVPFYHGMTRFFSVMYSPGRISASYGAWLLIDCVAFTAEAGLFFVLARSLPKHLWWRFNHATVALLCLDIVWGVFVWKCRQCPISSWVVVNVCAVPLLAGVYLFFNRVRGLAVLAPWAMCVLLLSRTVADYWTGWPFYFPR